MLLAYTCRSLGTISSFTIEMYVICFFFQYVALNYGRDKISRVVQTAYFNLGEINSLHYTARVIFVFLVENLK